MSEYYGARLPVMVVSLIVCAAACLLPPSMARACSRGAGWRTGLLQCFLVSCVCLVWAYSGPPTDHQHRSDSAMWRLAILRCVHYLVLMLSSMYAFLFRADAVADTVYLIFVLGLHAHWTFLEGECLLTLWEKRLLDPAYEMGSRPYEHVLLYLLLGPHVDGALQILTVLSALGCTLVLRRSFSAAPAFVVYPIVAGLWTNTIYFNYWRPTFGSPSGPEHSGRIEEAQEHQVNPAL